ncbi:MAG: hypothetical protein ABEJ92_03700 [Halobacteriales archaeon]
MADDAPRPDRPADLPADIAEALEAHASDAHDLQEAAIYAQELLNALHEPVLAIEAREGEEVLRVVDHGEYTEVVKRPLGAAQAYRYHVRREPRPEGDDRLRWVPIDRVDPDA